MKQMVKFIFLISMVFGLSGAGAHKFYVAVFQMDYVADKNVIQMTSRVFIDDLENAFKEEYKKKFYLGTSKELPEAKKYIEAYFLENIEVDINGKPTTIKYLGREVEEDVLVCYYTIPTPNTIELLEIKNTTLFGTYEEQENMMHININNNKKSLLLTFNNPKGLLKY
ncbi:MAG: hypothetical protein BM557_00760 [Flavobacterium sp. MedPE-SWcel]|uniref:DUF6702 family protein n=1 Tax=uncultured Flavobacterium sp. TaxID=165435 RepID=UPI00091EA859|nr:DUF6702 family protein [uncultured Flavobacterium sp.]OIQ22550.1 MAG: hypothetical protein BM557_00760 [Flavobacterium sp. MedPE-SWcel]